MKNTDVVLSELQGVFAKVFDKNDIIITEKTTANDIDEWDSLTHIQLIVAMEKHFNIRFTAQEIYNFKNVGDTCRTIQQKLPAT